MRRILPVLLTALLVLMGSSLSPGAASAAPRRTSGAVVVTLKAPKGVPARLVLRKTHSHAAPLLAVKAAKGTTATARLKLKPGTYSVSAPSFTSDGVRYAGSSSKSRVVVRAGGTVRVAARFRASAGSKDFAVTSIGGSSATLTWRSPKGAAVVLRVRRGSHPALSRTSGTAVAVHGHAARANRLRAGSTYSFSLFTRLHGRWTGPLVLQGRTASTGGSAKASYVAQPSTVFAKASQVASTSQHADSLSVVLAAGASLPQLGGAVVLPISAGLPGGFLGVVTGVAADGRTVMLRPGGLADAFQQYHLDSGSKSAVTGNLSATSLHRGSRLSKSSATHFSRQSASTSPAPAREAPESRLSCDPSVGVNLVNFRHHLDWDKYLRTDLDGTDATFDVGFAATATGSLDADVSGGGSCSVNVLSDVIPFSIDPVPMLLKFDVGAEVGVSSELHVHNLGAKIKGGYAAQGTIGLHGFRVSGGPIISGQPLTPSASMSNSSTIELKLGGSVAVGPGVGNTVVGAMAGVKGELALLDAKAELGPRGDGALGVCGNISAERSFEGSLDAQAWLGFFHAEAKKPLISLKSAYFPAFHAPDGCERPAPATSGGSQAPAPSPTETSTPSPTPPPTDTRSIASVSTSADLNCTLNTNEDSAGEYFGDSACGTFLSAGGTLYAPSSIPAGGNLSDFTTPVGWNPVSQSTTGSGTASDPYVVVTTADAATSGLRLVQTDVWVTGATSLSTTMQVINMSGSDQPVRLYRAFDCFTSDDDTGTGGIDLAARTVSCVHVNSSSTAVMSLRLRAVTPGATITEKRYSQVWSALSAQGDLDDTAVTEGEYDNGEAIAWAATVPAGGSASFEASTSFAGPM